MNAEVFIDTNVFLYSLSDNPDEHAKAERARQLLLSANWGWSVQVAGEFYSIATSPKRQFRLSHQLATKYVETWLNFPTASLNSSTVRNALQLADRFRISYWDAAIIAAADELGCRTIYSEDLSHKQNYDGVAVVNPFLV
ncbi:MAG TPA: PIN domain-containing protein [Pyrinomonadaceae bacterium]|nr:PIN domain-containing protein [Pyrinomonadaceae bacterium]